MAAASAVLLASSDAGADANHFLNSGISRARALAMGGAYYSVEDDLATALYNPGSSKLYAAKSERPFRIYLNPVASAAGMYDYTRYDRDYHRDDTLTCAEILTAASMLLKGAGYATPIFDAGIVLNEELPQPEVPRRLPDRFISLEGVTRSAMHAAFLNVKIAPTVSIGITGTLFSQRENGEYTYGSGYILGVVLAPDPRLNLGIAYHSIPKKFADARMELESIENEGATAGISYYPDDDTVLSIDLRNLNSEDASTSREIHTGIEHRFYDRIAMRAGYFRKKGTDIDVYSAGIGILPLWGRTSRRSHTARTDILSYTVMMENNGLRQFWHILSLSIRL